MLTVYSGRPADSAARSAHEMQVYDLLDRLQIPYRRVDHAAAETMEDCQAAEQALDTPVCKNLFLCNRQKTQYYLLLMPGDKPFRTKELSHQAGLSRLSFASSDAMEHLLGVFPGSVTPLGLMNDGEGTVQLLIDEDLLRNEHIGCHPCINTSTLSLRTDDLLHRFLPETRHTPLPVHLTGQMD